MAIYSPQAAPEALRNAVGNPSVQQAAIRYESQLANDFLLNQQGIRFEGSVGIVRVQDGEIVTTTRGQTVIRTFTVADPTNGSTTVDVPQSDTGAGTSGGNAGTVSVPYRAPWLDDQDRLLEQQQQQAISDSQGGSYTGPEGNVGDGGANFYFNPDEIYHQPIAESAPPPIPVNPVEYWVPTDTTYYAPDQPAYTFIPDPEPEPWYSGMGPTFGGELYW